MMMLCESPAEIKIQQDATIIVVDDDAAMHDAWDARFESTFSKIDNITVLHFNMAQDFIDYYKKNRRETTVCLVDYQFLGQSLNGIDVIEQADIASQSILATSAYEDPRLQQRCLKLDVPLLPKHRIFSVPFRIVCMKPDLICVDDSECLTSAWQCKAEDLGKRIVTYNKIDNFRAELNRYRKSTPIYIDSDLHDDVSGEVFAKELFNAGFINIYLATGHDKNKFKHLQWIKQVVGKDFPLIEQSSSAVELPESARASLSHELRTPMATIKTGISGVKDFLPALIAAYKIAQSRNLPIPEIQSRHLDMLTKTLNNVEKEARFVSDYINNLLSEGE